ncbi:MAG: isochorismatase family protein [Alphaproteobacteria bacterium]|jgi:maleamate amidohydrolase|nr:isochorismatase family protein [Alphaproteobacteria bacterium]
MSSDLDVYKKQNFGNPIGIGNSPALLIVDFVNGFDDADAFGGGNIPEAIATTKRLLAYARKRNLPVAHTRVIYADDGADRNIMCRKVPALNGLTEDAPSSQIVEALTPVDGEIVVRKRFPSAFFGTDLATLFTMRGIDTVLVTGCTTSGCVRASVLDAMCWGFRPIVVTDGCGDRAIGPHDANLFDMGQKYADLMTADEIMAKIDEAPAAAE